MRLLIIAAVAGAAALATPVVADAPSPLPPAPASGTGLAEGDCLLAHEIGRHSVVDDKTLLLSGFGRSRGVYRLTMRKGCLRSAISSDPIALNSPQTRGRICRPTEIDLAARSGHCYVDSIVKLSPQEVDALPRRLKP